MCDKIFAVLDRGRTGQAVGIHDMLAGPYEGQFGGIYSLDVLEHIEPAAEDRFLTNILASLSDDGAAIIGIPSLESQEYASEYSRMGHINCKEQPAFKELMKRFFRNVFMFSMNDELVHTGYSKMAHYNIALCCGKRVS